MSIAKIRGWARRLLTAYSIPQGRNRQLEYSGLTRYSSIFMRHRPGGNMAGLLLLGAFIAAQGAVIFGTAYVGSKMIRRSSRSAKAWSMLISWFAWVAFTIIGYGMLGGDGGLMDGFGLLLTLCFTALASTFIFLMAWVTLPTFRRLAG